MYTIQNACKAFCHPCRAIAVDESMVASKGASMSQYYTAQHRTLKWYMKLFLHFLDIAATNAHLLHKELMQSMQKDSMTHKAFLEELTAQLCDVTMKTEKAPVKNASNTHKPLCGPRAYRKVCAYCRTQGKQVKTPWMCKVCDVHLCLLPERNCYDAWHP